MECIYLFDLPRVETLPRGLTDYRCASSLAVALKRRRRQTHRAVREIRHNSGVNHRDDCGDLQRADLQLS